MNVILCQLAQILRIFLNVYIAALFVYAIVSWIPSIRGRWTYYLAAIIEPVLMPIRRIIPSLGGLDLSFLVLILVLQYALKPMLNASVFNTCYRPF